MDVKQHFNRRQNANISTCRLHSVVLSVFKMQQQPDKYFFISILSCSGAHLFGFLFNLFKLSVESRTKLARNVIGASAPPPPHPPPPSPCSWRQKHKLPNTKWQRSRPCSCDFQMPVINNKLDHKVDRKTACSCNPPPPPPPPPSTRVVRSPRCCFLWSLVFLLIFQCHACRLVPRKTTNKSSKKRCV